MLLVSVLASCSYVRGVTLWMRGCANKPILLGVDCMVVSMMLDVSSWVRFVSFEKENPRKSDSITFVLLDVLFNKLFSFNT